MRPAMRNKRRAPCKGQTRTTFASATISGPVQITCSLHQATNLQMASGKHGTLITGIAKLLINIEISIPPLHPNHNESSSNNTSNNGDYTDNDVNCTDGITCHDCYRQNHHYQRMQRMQQRCIVQKTPDARPQTQHPELPNNADTSL